MIFIWLNFNIRRLSIKLFFYATELIIKYIKYITEKGKKIGITIISELLFPIMNFLKQKPNIV